jgi:signal transduction histidine kinase
MTLSWYKSLYWRIALGLIAFLALMLAAEGALFIWTTDRIAGSMPARSPRRLAVLVASDVAAALAANPSLNLQQYIDEQYAHVFQSFLVVMRDGRVAANHDDVPTEFIEDARAIVAEQLRQGGGRRFLRRGFGGGPGGLPPNQGFERGREGVPREPGSAPDSAIEPGRVTPLPPDFGPRGTDDDGIPRPRIRPGEFAVIMVGGMPIGRVAVVPGGTSYRAVLRQLGPTMALVASGILGVGTTLIALIVFGPTRRRLKQVQDATQRLGAGDLAARAPDSGGDEVAALAQSFNRMADELGSRARALDAADKARRQLLADVSHELMTPLTAMRGYIETLAMPKLQLDEPTRSRYVGIITEETYRMERIIGDLLDLARLEGGGTTMRREPVAVAMLFDRVAARHEREMQSRQVRLIRDVEAGADQVTGDPDRLEQALQNLAANALRHTPDNGEIRLTASRREDGIHITVRDNGPGIAPEHLPLIFDRFYKVDASRKAAGGSGLGLSIVKTIVERHGGSIAAANDPSGGATFEVVLPS